MNFKFESYIAYRKLIALLKVEQKVQVVVSRGLAQHPARKQTQQMHGQHTHKHNEPTLKAQVFFLLQKNIACKQDQAKKRQDYGGR